MFEFINPSATLITEKDPLKLIESVGRTCYKSEDRITEDSARGFVRGLMKSNHTAMVEHSNIVFDISLMDEDDIAVFLSLMSCRFLNVTVNEEESRVLVSGNVRALNEAAGTWTGKEGGAVLLKTLDAHNPNLVYVDEALYRDADADGVKIIDIDTTPNLSLEELAQHKYLSFRLVTDRGVTHELVRHRIPSFGQESTRYVNYMEGIAICLPTGFYERPEIVQMEYQAAFVDADNHYRKLIELGEKPQQARAVLPTALKTEIVVTTNLAEWNHIWNLRMFGTTGAPHPDIKALMDKVYMQAVTIPTVSQYLALKEV